MSTPGPKPNRVTARLEDRQPPGTVQDDHPDPPESLPEQAHDAWHDLASLLAPSGAMVRSDYLILRELAQALTLARKYASALMDGIAEGTTEHIDRNGKVHEVPFLGSRRAKRLRAGWNQTLRHVSSLADDYGLTPSARARMGLDIAAGRSLMDALRDARPSEDSQAEGGDGE